MVVNVAAPETADSEVKVAWICQLEDVIWNASAVMLNDPVNVTVWVMVHPPLDALPVMRKGWTVLAATEKLTGLP